VDRYTYIHRKRQTDRTKEKETERYNKIDGFVYELPVDADGSRDNEAPGFKIRISDEDGG